MSFDENNFDTSEEAPLPEESNNNRTFLIAAAILGGIILISVACLVGVYLFSRQATTARVAQAEVGTQTAIAANAIINEALTATFEAAAVQPTATAVPPTLTPVVSIATITNTPDPNVGALEAGTPAAATATVAAALTQAAIAQLTVIPTSTLLPQTGLVEDVGVPGLAVMALAFIIVILLARRLRTAPVR